VIDQTPRNELRGVAVLGEAMIIIDESNWLVSIRTARLRALVALGGRELCGLTLEHCNPGDAACWAGGPYWIAGEPVSRRDAVAVIYKFVQAVGSCPGVRRVRFISMPQYVAVHEKLIRRARDWEVSRRKQFADGRVLFSLRRLTPPADVV
jgi:hypothetical protein